jgi:hypothetical protein
LLQKDAPAYAAVDGAAVKGMMTPGSEEQKE